MTLLTLFFVLVSQVFVAIATETPRVVHLTAGENFREDCVTDSHLSTWSIGNESLISKSQLQRYNAELNRGVHDDNSTAGEFRTTLIINGVPSTLNGSRISCSTANETVLSLTLVVDTPAVDEITTRMVMSDVATVASNVSSPGGADTTIEKGVIAAIIIVSVVSVMVILSDLIVSCVALIYYCKRRGSDGPTEDTETEPGDQQQPPPVASQEPVVPAQEPSNEQSTGSTTARVTGISRRSGLRSEPQSNVSRVNETNGSTERAIDLDVVDINTRCTSMRSPFVHGENESYEIPPSMPKVSQEMTEHCEEHSLPVPCYDGNKNASDLRKHSFTHVALPGSYLQCFKQSDEETHDPETNQTTTELAQ